MMDRNKRWLFLIFGLTFHVNCSEEIQTDDKNHAKSMRGVFSPRMDYEQWKPLGRGDPLKNDPTYDYVPPVLDRVHYWMDPDEQSRKIEPTPGENKKTEILLLGVSSIKPSTGASISNSRRDIYDPYMKFVDSPKYSTNHYQRRPQYSVPASYYPSPFYSNNRNKITDTPSGFTKPIDNKFPYTILMPPPMSLPQSVNNLLQNTQQKPSLFTTKAQTSFTTSKSTSTNHPTTIVGTTVSEVTLEPAKLVYQSSTSLDTTKGWTGFTKIPHNSWHQTTPKYTTVTPKYPKLPFNPDVVLYNDFKPPESYIQIQFSPSKFNKTNRPLTGEGSEQSNNYVTPPISINNEIMHKGQVQDDALDVSNTYVKIGKTEAQMHASGDGEDIIRETNYYQKPPQVTPPNMVFSQIKHPLRVDHRKPVTMQSIQTMQTKAPVMYVTNPSESYTLPQKESTTFTSAPKDILEGSESQASVKLSVSTVNTITHIVVEATTPMPPTTTTLTTMTTDPLFKHYKQPKEPVKGPLYLIIQGHSKVKTYGPSKQIHGIKIQDSNEITDDQNEYQVKHLHGFDNTEIKPFREGRSNDLQTLKHVLQTGLGAIDDKDLKASERKDDFQEANLHAGYQIVEQKDSTSERYRKGIVEQGRQLKID